MRPSLFRVSSILMRGKWVPVFGIVLLAGITAGALYQLQRHTAPAPLPKPAPKAAVFSGAEIMLPGTVRAHTVVPVAAPIEGTLDLIEVQPGESVYEGQAIAHILNTGLENSRQTAASDLEEAQARVNELQNQLISARAGAARDRGEATRAQAAYEAAQRVFERQQVLYKAGATPRLVYEKAEKASTEAKTQWDTLAAVAAASEERASVISRNLDAAKKTLDEKKQAADDAANEAAAADLRSPVDGVVVACTRRVGDEVGPAVADLFQIAVNLNDLEAVVDAQPPVLARIRPGQDALIVSTDLPESIPAKVAGVDHGQIIVRFTSPSPVLQPGAAVQVRIKLS
jgi:multidrug resistance efflux pump